MIEKEKSKIKETKAEEAQYDKTNKLSVDMRQFGLTKISTQASNNVNCDINLTQNSVQNIYGENKFKIQYETLNKEEIADKRKKNIKFKININHKEISRLKKSNTAEITENNIITSDLIEIKSTNIIDNKNKDKDLYRRNINKDENNNNNNYSTKSSKVKVRKDAFGAKILTENKKNFKVSFFDLLHNKDEISKGDKVNENRKNGYNNMNKNNYNYNFGVSSEVNNKQFVEVIKVESYKKYYLILNNDEEFGKVRCKSCSGCCIF